MIRYTLTFTEADLKKLEICYFTLNYLSGFSCELDQIKGGLAAVTENACGQMDDLAGRFYNAVYEQDKAAV